VRRLILILLACAAAHAHEPGLSSADFRVAHEGTELVLTFAVDDMDNMFLLDNDGNGKVSQLEFGYGKAKLAPLANEAADITIDGVTLKGTEPALRMDDLNNIEFIIRYPERMGSNFVYRCAIFSKLPGAHRQFATLKDASGKIVAEKLLDAQSDTLRFPGDEPAGNSAGQKKTFWGFLLLGIEHILTGYDHLLFLFALLLVTREFLSAVKIITCFTVAHSITLALATFNIVNIPGRIVEPLIAATIIYVGIENIILRREPKGRWLLTFGFGLIHGFGFAGILRDLGIASGSSGIAVPLVSFNLGVELGQIAVAAVLLPIIWCLSRKPDFAMRWVPACSVLVAAAGAYWFIERVWGG
jgi:hydrogenase/urease accessory protein HupE